MFILAWVLPREQFTYKAVIFTLATREQSLTVMSFHKKRQLGIFKWRILQNESSKQKREVRQVAICWTLTDTPPHLSWVLRMSGAVKDIRREKEGGKKEWKKRGRRAVGWEEDEKMRVESYLRSHWGLNERKYRCYCAGGYSSFALHEKHQLIYHRRHLDWRLCHSVTFWVNSGAKWIHQL